MTKKLAAPAAALLALIVAVPAFAGGAYCSGAKGASASAWSGAWLQRTASGLVTVADVAKGSPAARSGLKAGDVVTAVNGHELADREHGTCSPGECNVGSAVTYTVQRGHVTRAFKVKLEKMPANATYRFANREASFDPTLATLVMPASN